MNKPGLKIPIDLHFTDSQRMEMLQVLERIGTLANWVDSNAPTDIRNYHKLQHWALRKCREIDPDLFSRFTDRAISKVSSKRIKGSTISMDFLFFCSASFDIQNGVLRMRFVNDRQDVAWSTEASEISQAVLKHCVIKSGTLQRLPGDQFKFVLNIQPLGVIEYSGSGD